MKTAVVTGASSGIGFALTCMLLDKGWDVAALVRNSMPNTTTLDRATGAGRLRLYTGDLSDANSRRRALWQMNSQEPRINVIFNNAGVSAGGLAYSPSGRELHFEVNTVAPYVVAQMLETRLVAGGRIVNTSSDAIFMVKRYDPDNLRQPKRFRRIVGPYGSSKLALSLWTRAMAPELSKRDHSIVSVTPGPISTPLLEGPGMPTWMRPLAKLFAKSPNFGASCLLNAAEGVYPTGSFIMKGKVKKIPFDNESERTLKLVEALWAEKPHER